MCAKFCADSPYSLAVGGHKNGFHIIDVSRLLPGISIQHAVFSWCQFPPFPLLIVVIQKFKKRDLLKPVMESQEVANGISDAHNGTVGTKENVSLDLNVCEIAYLLTAKSVNYFPLEM